MRFIFREFPLDNLKRLADAEAHGDRILALIAACGASNDQRGGLLAPESAGQLRALEQAWDEAGWHPDEVDLVECHATGTPLGDRTEWQTLNRHWQKRGGRSPVVIGSVKSNCGHLLTGAGVPGLMRVILAFGERRFPPTANFRAADPQLMAEGPFRVLSEAGDWPDPPDGRPRRAALNGFGFGGINAHVLLEEYRPAAAPLARLPAVPAGPRQVAVVAAARLQGSDGGPARYGFSEDMAGAVTGLRGPLYRRRGYRELPVAAGRFRISPLEVQVMLPQQVGLLGAAHCVLDKVVPEGRIDAALARRTGVFAGIGTEPAAALYSLRWQTCAGGPADWNEFLAERGIRVDREADRSALRDAFIPPLTADRVMGSLGGVIAGRVAREFGFGGASFGVSGEENAGIRALEKACRAIGRGDLDMALVGAVDFPGGLLQSLTLQGIREAHGLDPVLLQDGAVTLLLHRIKPVRLADALQC